MKVKKFHQFVRLDRGPVNSAVIDLLKGNVYQVENEVIANLEQGNGKGSVEFMEAASKEDLMIEIDDKCWLPPCVEEEEEYWAEYSVEESNLELHLEEGVDLSTVLEKLEYYSIYKIVFYGQKIPEIPNQQIEIVKKEKDFEKCVNRTRINGEFGQITEPIYRFNKKHNSCWGKKVAITRDGKVRPCIYSTIVVGDIDKDDIDDIMEKMKEYWDITKDKVEKCRDCELRFVCFDCREIARREGGDMFSANPGCHYDPYKGTWSE